MRGITNKESMENINRHENYEFIPCKYQLNFIKIKHILFNLCIRILKQDLRGIS